MGWSEAMITLDGIALVTELINGGKLKITRAEISENTVDATALALQKTVLSPLNVPVVIAQKDKRENSLNICVQVHNTGAVGNHRMRQLGLYAQTETSEEKLFALLQNGFGEEIPPEDEYPQFLLEFTAVITVSNADNISVTIEPASVIVTKAMLDRALADKADRSELPTTLPANGGNADTVNGHTVNADVPENAVFTDTVYSLPAATKTALGGVKVGDNLSVAADGTLSAPIYSNPNLLDNPDFKINQRGVSGTITAAGYFVDRWKLKSGSVTVNDNKTLTLNGTIEQILENAAGANVTASSNAGAISYNNSTKTVSLTGQNVTVSWVKLELGNKATPFVPPSPGEELMKCMYYYERGVCVVHLASDVFPALFLGLTFAAPKRVAPTVKMTALYYNGVDKSSEYFNNISNVQVVISTLDPRFMLTNGIPTSKGTIKTNDYLYKTAYEASADI